MRSALRVSSPFLASYWRSTSMVYYGDGNTETYTYRPNGLLLSAANGTMRISFVRDVLGNVLQGTQGAHTVTNKYDMHGRRMALTSSLGAAVRYTCDATGRIDQIQTGNWQAAIAHDAQSLKMHRSLSGGLRTHWKRDSLGRPTTQQISAGQGCPDRTRNYAWQPADRLTHIQDSSKGSTHYKHDAVGNLAVTSFGDIPQFRLPDAVGNLFTVSTRQDRRYGPAGQRND